jgi:predicted DNA-binding antitoxin AbrB/MazE fold protein
MKQQIEAIYENGVFRPLAPVAFGEAQRVRITITDADPTQGFLDSEFVERVRTEVAALKHRPSIEEVRAKLTSIRGSMAETVIEERGEF